MKSSSIRRFKMRVFVIASCVVAPKDEGSGGSETGDSSGDCLQSGVDEMGTNPVEQTSSNGSTTEHRSEVQWTSFGA